MQEKVKITIILLDNHGFGSIGLLSESIGPEGFGTNYRYRKEDSGHLDGDLIAIDSKMIAHSYGVGVHSPETYEELNEALEEAKKADVTQVIVVQIDKVRKVSGYHSWWDVPEHHKCNRLVMHEKCMKMRGKNRGTISERFQIDRHY